MPGIRAGRAWIEFTLRRSRRARRVSIRVSREGAVELVVPVGGSEAGAVEFLRTRTSWVLARLEDLGRSGGSPAAPEWPSEMRTWSLVPWRGRSVELILEPVDRGRPSVRLDGAFVVSVPPGSTAQEASRAVKAWMREALSAEASSAASGFAGMLGLPVPRIRIREMSTLWGSCGSTGVVTVNWHLAFLPPRALEYTVAHEVCHLKVRGHGRAFWEMLGRILPGYAEGREILRLHGSPRGYPSDEG